MTVKPIYLEDLLSAREAARAAGIAYSTLSVYRGQGRFPQPVRRDPDIWLREQVADWLAERKSRAR